MQRYSPLWHWRKPGGKASAGIDVLRFPHQYPYIGLSGAARSQLDMRAGNLFSFPLLSHLYSASPPDIYHLHTGKRMGGIVRTAARHHRRPYVISLHGGVIDVPSAERDRWTEPTRKTLEWGRVLGAAVGARRVLEDADAILCVNRSEQHGLQDRFPGKRIVWTPNTVDVQRYARGCGQCFRAEHRIPASAQVVLHVARIDEQKNQLGAVDVFDMLATTRPDLWLVFAGPSTNIHYAERLRLRIAKSPAASRILCLGNIDAASQELVDLYKAATVFLLTSLHEPFGIVLLEAWAAGLPIVAANVGGVPSFVRHNENGLLYPSGDLSAAAAAVRSLLTSTNETCRLIEQAAIDVQAFDQAYSGAALLRLYEEVIREHSLRA